MKKHELIELELLFIRFISERNSQPVEKSKEVYLDLKRNFDFSSKEYRLFCEKVHSLYGLFYASVDDQKLIEAYKKLEYLHIFRHLSYVFPVKKTFQQRIVKGIKTLINRRLAVKPSCEILLEILYQQKEKVPIVVDYGAGLGHLSFKIGQLIDKTKIFLVDIDSIILEFASFYFKQMQLDISLIKIDVNNLYPVLPECNVCICSEVLEHICNPHLVLDNIIRSLQKGGLLYGEFDDHIDEFLHVSTDLSDIRLRLNSEFDKIAPCIYCKK